MEPATIAIIVQLLCLTIQLPRATASDAGTSPQFVAQPSNRILALERDAVLDCGVTGTPPPSVTWYKDDATLALDARVQQLVSGSLSVSDVRLSDGGDYYCVASNAVGSVRSLTASVELANFPSIPSPMIVTSIIVQFDSLVLECNIPESIPQVTVEWTHKGSSVSGSDNRIGVTLGGKLVLSWFNPNVDLGFAHCFVSNSVTEDRVMSSSILLTKNVTAGNNIHEVQLVSTPSSQTAIAGEMVKLECFSTGSPVATTTWTKDEIPLPASSTEQSSRVLVINPVTSGDAGTYTCTATQQLNGNNQNVVQASAVLTVIVPPTIVESFSETAVLVTQPVSLTCRVEGTPIVHWQWRKDNEIVPSTSGVSFDTTGTVSTLALDSVGVGDGGVYQCVAENRDIGRQATANELLVNQTQPPSFTHGSTLEDTLLFVGDTTVLPCTATGFPPPTFSWTRGMDVSVDVADVRISVSEKSNDGSLTIMDARVGDSSSYKCTAENSVASVSTSTVNLRVIENPTVAGSGIVDTPQSTVPNPGDTVTLKCSISDLDGIEVQYVWTKDQSSVPIQVVGGSSGDYHIDDVTTSNNGNYTCSVRLSISGNAAAPLVITIGSALVTVGEPPTAPSPPLNPSPESITSTSFLAHWTEPTFNGGLQIIRYSIELRNLGRTDCPSENTDWINAVTATMPEVDAESGRLSAEVEFLVPSVQYQFRVIATNSGGFSNTSAASDTLQTSEAAPSTPPTMVDVKPNAIIASELQVTWQPPVPCSSHNGILIGYIVTYSVSEGETRSEATVELQHTLTNLKPKTTYHIQVAAETSAGRGPASAVVMETTDEITTPSTNSTQEMESTAFYKQVWFIAAVAVGGAVVIVLIIAVVCVAVCCRLSSRSGKTYISSFRAGSSLSAESNGFSEYQHKKRSNSTSKMSHVRVHSSPTPSRRTTDYADMQSLGLRSQNGGPPSIGYADSIMSGLTDLSQPTGPYPPLPERQPYPFNHLDQAPRDQHLQHSQQYQGIQGGHEPESARIVNPINGYDHIQHNMELEPTKSTGLLHGNTVELPPPPPFTNPPLQSNPPSYPGRAGGAGASLSQDSDISWYPSDNLNFRGHMSNKGSKSELMQGSSSSIDNDSKEGAPSPARPIQNGYSSHTSSVSSLDQRLQGHVEPVGHHLGHSRQTSHQSMSSRSQLPPVREHAAMDTSLPPSHDNGEKLQRGMSQPADFGRQHGTALGLNPRSAEASRGGVEHSGMQFHHSQSLEPRTVRPHQSSPPLSQPTVHQGQFQDPAYYQDELPSQKSYSPSSISPLPPQLSTDMTDSGSERGQKSHRGEARLISQEQLPLVPGHQQQGNHDCLLSMPEGLNQWRRQQQGTEQPHTTAASVQGLNYHGEVSSSHRYPYPPPASSHEHAIHTSSMQQLGNHSARQPTSREVPHQTQPPPSSHLHSIHASSMQQLGNHSSRLQTSLEVPYQTQPPPSLHQHAIHTSSMQQLENHSARLPTSLDVPHPTQPPPPSHQHSSSMQQLGNHSTRVPEAQHHKPNPNPKPGLKPKPQSLSHLDYRPPPQSLPKGRNIPDVLHDFDAQHRRAVNVPYKKVTNPLEASKPRIKKTKVPREIWKPKPMTGTIESSSESDGNSSTDESLPGDNTSLKSEYV